MRIRGLHVKGKPGKSRTLPSNGAKKCIRQEHAIAQRNCFTLQRSWRRALICRKASRCFRPHRGKYDRMSPIVLRWGFCFSPTTKTMKIEELTIGEAREIAALFNAGAKPETHPFEVGKPYLIRTVTMINAGTLIAVYPTELVLRDASWIADTGRFADAVRTAEFSEVEPFPDGEVIIGRGSIIDAVRINKIPRSQK